MNERSSQPPARIVACTPSSAEILCLLGAEKRLVGCCEGLDLPIPVSKWTPVGPPDNIDPDKVASLNPDLVIHSNTYPGAEVAIHAMESQGLHVLNLTTERFDDLLSDMFAVGVEIGEEDKAAEWVARFDERRRRLLRLVPRSDRPLRVYIELWPNPFVTAGAQSWMTDMIKLAGGKNAFADRYYPSYPIDEERILEEDPEAVLICWAGQGDDPSGLDPDDIFRRKGWEKLAAVRFKQVYFLPESLFAVPGPRLLDGLEHLIGLFAGLQRDEVSR